jgi:GMP synthase-like glutamine amidotransferase
LPKVAVSLAHLTDSFNQAFRYGQRAYRLQYRIELTEDMLDTWLHDAFMKKEFIDVYGSEAYREVEQDAVELFPAYVQHATTVLKNFFKLSELISSRRSRRRLP